MSISDLSATELSILCYILFIFVGLIVYFLLPRKIKWISLLVLSYVCATILTSYWVIFIFIMDIIAYVCTKLINKNIVKYKEIKSSLEKSERKLEKKKYKKKNKTILIIFLCISFLILASLKYFGLPISSLNSFFESYSFLDIALPILGISYYTLIAVSYMVDVYREKYECQHNFFKVALFVGYFPSLIEGPFSRYDNIKDSLYKTTNPVYDNIVNGISLMVWGIFLKLVVADRIDMITDAVFSDYTQYTKHTIMIAIGLYVIEIYCDFKGFIALARGASEVFGVKLAKNFNVPLMSDSASDFWRRWHITLGAWLKDYIFYPLALSKPVLKISKKIHNKVPVWLEKIIINVIPLFFVWLICGMWHGSGSKYIVYGMYYFIIIVIEMFITVLRKKIFKKDHIYLHVIGIIRTLCVITIGMTLFKASSLYDFFSMIGNIFVSTGSLTKSSIMGTKELNVMCVTIGIVIFVDLVNYFRPKLTLEKLNPWIKMICVAGFIVAIFLIGCYGNNYTAVDPGYAAF